MKKITFTFLILFLFTATISAQKRTFTRQDTLRGSITEERSWWDLTYYHLDIAVNPQDSSITGTNTIQYKVLKEYNVMQVDLQAPLSITEVLQDGKNVLFERDGSVYYLKLKGKQKINAVKEVKIVYSGKPVVAVRPPWGGGYTWERDSQNKPFIATSCQGIGASIWWPCKDHLYDEPDSMLISITVPENLMDVSNGTLRKVEQNDDHTKTYHWFVNNPINNYGVNVNIADYAHFSENYEGEKGTLTCDYYVLKENLEKAKKQFKQASLMLEAFEHWFGPYPFYEDGFKLVEVPYLGMEHQSSVTYGNGYQNGYRGRDLSGTGWGLKFDFIIIHESGHEWFANNITYKDIADMWIHESFTNYSENLYVEYHYGKEAGAAYVIGTRKGIRNDRPIIGVYDVNRSGSGDMYSKGGNMLHTLRQVVDDDEKWRGLLRGMNRDFYHQTVTTQQIESYMSEKLGLELSWFFDQYLRDVRIPVLEYKIKKRKLYYRWTNCVDDFKMPVKVKLSGKEQWLRPTSKWAVLKKDQKISSLEIDVNFYITSEKLSKRKK